MNKFDYDLSSTPSNVCCQIMSSLADIYILRVLVAHWIVAHIRYKINITIIDTSVSYLPPCTTMCSAISDILADGTRRSKCWAFTAQLSNKKFFSSAHEPRVALFTSETFLSLHMLSRLQDDSFGEFTFIYLDSRWRFSLRHDSHEARKLSGRATLESIQHIRSIRVPG